MPSLLTLSIMVGAIATPVVADIYNVNVPSGFFSGPQSGIGSWYRASTGQDSTNGQSWCGYKYYNSDPVFAPSLKAMGGATYNSNPDAWRQQTRKYCGLEAKVTDPTTGKSLLMYIGDSFDDQWVRTPASIDIMIDAYSNIHGNPNGDKNNVIKGVQWELTGRVNTKYAAPGASWPPTSGGSGGGSGGGSSTGGLGAKCDGQTKLCNSGLTCLSPDGVCSDKACNWGDGLAAQASRAKNLRTVSAAFAALRKTTGDSDYS
ncbi:hypothetical protein FPCIR_11093 [Fusarium pseudocircinatum]|uniref:Uncharacterized protein n=1 Tax=Fusarium pseudocircinatum TaxID=56676 RepID=A0A8H5KRY6_9HYPO|nr:hypothetical protein FPCIR_11093 [Fusarium pseudocircinatum]